MLNWAQMVLKWAQIGCFKPILGTFSAILGHYRAHLGYSTTTCRYLRGNLGILVGARQAPTDT